MPSLSEKPTALMTLIGRFKSLDRNLDVVWNTKTAVQLRLRGEDRFTAKIVTNIGSGLRIELRAPAGVITPTQVDRLGEGAEIKRHDAYDRVVFWLRSLAQNDAAQLSAVWRMCCEASPAEELRSA